MLKGRITFVFQKKLDRKLHNFPTPFPDICLLNIRLFLYKYRTKKPPAELFLNVVTEGSEPGVVIPYLQYYVLPIARSLFLKRFSRSHYKYILILRK